MAQGKKRIPGDHLPFVFRRTSLLASQEVAIVCIQLAREAGGGADRWGGGEPAPLYQCNALFKLQLPCHPALFARPYWTGRRGINSPYGINCLTTLAVKRTVSGHCLKVFYRCKRVTDGGLRAIGLRCFQLRRLCISGCKAITDLGLESISSDLLRALDLGGCRQCTTTNLQVTAKGRWPKLERLVLPAWQAYSWQRG
jgi:hypothetical protein